jgi:uncharacterized pyridoxamine 5'-phosphate oxidase family protein
MKEVLNYLKENPVFYLATVEADQARVRPFGAVAEFEGKLYICTNNTKKVFQQIMNNPKIEICGTDNKGGCLRIEGKAIRDDRDEARNAMLNQNPGLKNLYHIGDGIFEVLYLTNATAAFSSMTGESKIVTFN